jgi:hypothetical protein
MTTWTILDSSDIWTSRGLRPGAAVRGEQIDDVDVTRCVAHRHGTEKPTLSVDGLSAGRRHAWITAAVDAT